MSEWALFGPAVRNALARAEVTGFEWWEVSLSSDPGYTE